MEWWKRVHKYGLTHSWFFPSANRMVTFARLLARSGVKGRTKWWCLAVWYIESIRRGGLNDGEWIWRMLMSDRVRWKRESGTSVVQF